MAAEIVLDYVSPSALETFMSEQGGCPRKWAWHKLDGLPKVQTDAAKLGDETHKHHEAWLRFGIPYDQTTYAGRLAAATEHLLPPPGVATVEGYAPGDRATSEKRKVTTVKIAMVTFGGIIDAHAFDAARVVPVIWDHKTTGSAQWAKLTKEALLGHPQAPIYAVYGLEHYKANAIDLRWNYVVKTKNNPKPLPSWHTVTAQEAYDAVSPFIEPAHQMKEVVRLANTLGIRAKQVPFDVRACDNYGGCPYRSNCNLSRKEVLDQMTQPNPPQTGNFMDRLRSMTAAAPSNGAAPALGFTVPDAAPPVVSNPMPTTFQVPPPPPAPIGYVQQAPTPAAVPVIPPQQVGVMHYGGQINPPESALPPPPAGFAPAVAQIAPVAQPAQQATPAPAAPTPPEAPKTRGRPRKAKETPATAPDGGTVVNIVSDKPDYLLYAIAQGVAANPGYVGADPKTLAEFINALHEAVAG